MDKQLSVGLSVLAVILLTTTAWAQSPCRCCEPRIKFLDDLFGGDSSPRDPFEERIETERHDFTQSTKTVGCGVVQIEGGYDYFYKDNDGEIEQIHSSPEMLVRFGLSDDIEFRIRWNFVWQFFDLDDNESAAEDMRWSFKLAVTDQEYWVPESALELRFSAPTGGRSVSTRRVEAGVDYIYGWELADGWTLYGSSGFATQGLGDVSLLPDEPASDRFIVWSQSVALGIEMSERTTAYLEWFGLFSHALAEDYTLRFFNAGIDYYVTDDFVVDLRAGVGLSGDADDFFGGIGGGYRF